jgi:methionyl-tRNA formyltransferase
VRLVFAGTPTFAAAALAALMDAGHHIELVLTQPERPSGRGLKAVQNPVQALAAAHKLPLYQPQTLRSAEALDRIADAQPEAMVVAAYGLILPEAILALPDRGALNIHASLLPRWRGAAPIQRAILAGDTVTGITIMQMDAGLDTGPILLQQSIAITAEDDGQSVHDRLASLGATLIVAALEALARGALHAVPQANERATYAAKITRDDAVLDWSLPAMSVERAVRAFRPFPGASTRLGDVALKIWRARVAPGRGEPGTVLRADAEALRIACGEAAVDILELQRPGGRRLEAREFLHGFSVRPGERFGATR